MNDFAEINRMTLYEYEMRMTASQLKRLDREYWIHLQAWENWNVQAMKPQGKRKRVPLFKTFKQFFDYAGREKEILGGEHEEKESILSGKNKGIAEILKKQMERRQGDAGEL